MNDVNKKLLRSGIFILILIVVLFSLNYRYMKSEAYFGVVEGVKPYEQGQIPEKLQIVNLGSSHSLFGIDLSLFPEYRSFSFAFTSQMLLIDSCLLTKYQNHLDEDCVVIIPVSYFSYYMKADRNITAQIPRYARILSINEFTAISWRDYIIGKYFPVCFLSKEIWKIFTYNNANSDSIYVTNDKAAVPDSLEEEGKRSSDYYKSIAGNQEVDELQAASLINILKLCRQNNWKPVLVTTPLTRYHNKWYSSEFLDTFREQTFDLIRDFPEAVYWDYSDDDRFYDHYEYFMDSQHLNKSGQELFTSILIEDCRNAGYL